jgi:hypothetical protein
MEDWICIRPAPRLVIPYPATLAIAWFKELWADHVSHRMPVAMHSGMPPDFNPSCLNSDPPYGFDYRVSNYAR